MWRLSRRDTSVSDWCERKQILHDSNEDQELHCKALNKVLQHTLFEFHDQHRRNINKLWAARDQLEGMMEQYKTYKNTKKYPKFLAKMDLPQLSLANESPKHWMPKAAHLVNFWMLWMPMTLTIELKYC